MSDIVRSTLNAFIDSLYRFLCFHAVSLAVTCLILALSSLVLNIVTDLSTFCTLCIRFLVIFHNYKSIEWFSFECRIFFFNLNDVSYNICAKS